MLTQTKIVCTIGPASEKQETMEKMIEAGMNIARLNFSHGTYKHHAMLINRLRAASKKTKKPVGILQDLQGPKIRLGEIDGEIVLKKGQGVVLTCGEASKEKIPVTYKGLHQDVKRGDRVLLDDGLLELEVESVFKKDIRAIVKVGGRIISHKGINLPDSVIRLSSLTPKDKEDLKFGLKNKVDFVALSFARTRKDILEIKKLFPIKNPPFLIVKIEKGEAVKNFDGILEATDGVMIARGDLAVEIPTENVPVVQKEIVGKCLASAKPVIVATQMLHSMMENPRPTRAEVSDVANAVIDHADALMLSGESAVGKYPAESVEMMKKIIKKTEESRFDDLKEGLIEIIKKDMIMGEVVKFLSKEEKIKAIVAVSDSAHAIRMISRFRPEVPIYASASRQNDNAGLLISWGVRPKFISASKKLTAIFTNLLQFLKKNKEIKKGDKIISVLSEKNGETVEVVRI